MARRPVSTTNSTKKSKSSPLQSKAFLQGFPHYMGDAWRTLMAMLTNVASTDYEDVMLSILEKQVSENKESMPSFVAGESYIQHNVFIAEIQSAVAGLSSAMESLSSGNHQLLKVAKSSSAGTIKCVLESSRPMIFGASNVPGGDYIWRTKEPFAPIIKLFNRTGIDLNIGTDIKSAFDKKQTEFKFPKAYGSSYWPVNELVEKPKPTSIELSGMDIISGKIDFDVRLDEVSCVITPRIVVEFDSSLYNSIVNVAQSDSGNVNYFYVFMWIKNALRYMFTTRKATRRTGWKGGVVFDLKRVSELLRNTQQKHGAVKPRVDGNNFSMSTYGFPVIIPNVDRCVDYVNDITKNVSVDDDGNYTFQEKATEWANKIILTDWFNDYVLYANSSGDIKYMPLLGYVPLTKSTEWSFLDMPWSVRGSIKDAINDTIGYASSEVDETYAAQFVKPEVVDYFGGKLPSIHSAFQRMVGATYVDRKKFTANAFKSNSTAISVKHLLGIDMEELNGSEQEIETYKMYAAVIVGYLKGMGKKLRRIEDNFNQYYLGVRYFAYAAEKYSDEKVLKAFRDEVKKERELMKQNAEAPEEIDLPNIDTSDAGLTGLLPHQVNALMATKGHKTDLAAYPIATGGGKGVVSFVEILNALDDGFCKRPLLLTKPRLVKENISEINRLSKGKINVVPIRTRNIRHLKRKAGLETAKDFINWAKSLPKNTIFVAAYSDMGTRSTLFEDLEVPGKALWYDVSLSQMVHILRLIGIDYVFGDESHLIKNYKSQRSRCSYSVFSSADMRRVASGTMSPNTPIDYLGQMFALNPVILGAGTDKGKEEFEDNYNIVGGLIKSDDAARDLNARMNELVRVQRADEEDWAYVLPILKDEIIRYTLTPLQEEFYNILMQEAYFEMLKMEKDGKVPGDDEDFDEEDDKDDEDEDEDEEEEEDKRMIAKATAALAKVEQFLVAPDENEQYRSWVKNPQGKDLISPSVFAMDAYIDKHFAGLSKDLHRQNKIIWFGWNLVASKHFMRWTKHKDIALHYSAGNEEIVRRFKTEDDMLVMVADEGSLREGENLQMSSVILRAQPVWTPGDYVQARARAYRPDPRGKYASREDVKHVWFIAEGGMGRPTVASVKLSVMISKAISNARIQYEHDISWMKLSPEFRDLKKLRMNLQLIFKTQPKDVEPYMNKWHTFNGWIANRVSEAKFRVARQLEQKHDIELIDDATGKIKDIKQFMKLVMRPVISTRMLPGSRKEYVPWESGALPPDHYGLGEIAILGGQKVRLGDAVVTEFGAGVVAKAESDRSITITLANGKNVTLRRLAVGIPKSLEGIKKLNKIVSNKANWKATYMSPRIKPSATPSVVGLDSDKEGTKKLPIKDNGPIRKPDMNAEVAEAEIFTAIINGWPFLAIEYDQVTPALMKQPGWKYVTPYVAYTFANWTQASKFLDILVKRYYMKQSKFDALQNELEVLKDGRAMKLKQRVTESEVRSFFLAQHKRLGQAKNGKHIIDPYWIANGDQIFLAFDRDAHSPEVIRWLANAASKVTGMRKSNANKEGYAVFAFRKMSEAVTAIKMAGKVLDLDEAAIEEELQELKEDIQAFNRRKALPR